MRSVRLLVLAAILGAGLLVPATAHAAPLAFFTETSHSEIDSWVAGATPLRGDFNGDGKGDVFLYRPGSGKELLLYGNRSRGSWMANASTDIQISGSYVPVVGDFNANGSTDILWYAAGSAPDTLWSFNKQSSTFVITKPVINGTYRPFVGDFTSNDGQGTDDIFWYAPGTGADSIWKGVAGRRVSFSSIPQRISGSYTPLVGSFTPDPGTGGSTDSTLDIFWYAPGATADSLWKGDGNGHFVPQNYSVGGTYKPVVGFFDGYGVQDIFWYSANGADSVWLADPDTQKFTAHGASIGAGYTPITGEFTIPDEPIYWWSATGADHFWIPQGEPGTWDYSELSNNTDMGGGYKPVTLDFDGDGHNDILWLGNGTTHTKIWWGPG